MSSLWYDRFVGYDGPENAPILFVGEAPGETEHAEGKPFVGSSGDLLIKCLGRNGLSRDEVKLANLFCYRPIGNKFEKLLGTDELKKHIRYLYDYIEQHKPVVIAALGKWPLHFLTGKDGIAKWRGSILEYLPDKSIKVIATYHPAAVLRERGLYPAFDKDIKRIIGDAAFRERRLPERQFILDPRGMELEEWTQRLCAADTLACDIETVKKSTHILCVGFAPSKDVGVCIVPTHNEGRRAIERVLASPAKKVFQFGTFDTTQLRINKYLIADPYANHHERPYYWDTLIAQHTIAPELPRSLEFMTSIYTREPYYKTVGRGTIPDDEKGWSIKVDKQSLYEYNAKDCCCTYEIYEHQREIILGKRGDKWREPNFVATFDFEMSMLETLHHIADSGMLVDKQRREVLRLFLLSKWAQKQYILDNITRYETNVRSPRLSTILYDKKMLGLPVRRNREGGLTTDEDAIVSLISFCKDKVGSLKREDSILEWKLKLGACQLILEIRGIRQLLSNYIRETDKIRRTGLDGRIHSTYKFGPETGRLSSTKYVDGTGLNAQTMPRDPVEVPDEVLTKLEEQVKLESQLKVEQDEEEPQPEDAA